MVGKRELKALQEGTPLVDSGRSRRKPSSKPAVQSTKGSTRSKGKQKTSPVTKKEPPRIATSTRVRVLRSGSMASSPVSKPTSPTSVVEHEENPSESSRDELNLLEEADEEDREKELDDVESQHGGAHPKKKRKRIPKMSMPGDDEDYLPDEVERSLKKRKLEAKEHDLDHSLDAIDLGQVLEMVESNTPAKIRKGKKAKRPKKKKKEALPEEPLGSQGSSSDSTDKGSQFRPSPDMEGASEGGDTDAEMDGEAFRRLSPATQARSHRLNADSRAYKPSGESESESDSQDTLAVPKKRRKRGGGLNKAEKANPAASPSGGDAGTAEKLGEPHSEDLGIHDAEMVFEGDERLKNVTVVPPTNIDKSAVTTKQPPPPQQSANERASWGFGQLARFWRSNDQGVASPGSSGTTPPATDQMDID